MPVLIRDDGFHPSQEISYDGILDIWVEPEQPPKSIDFKRAGIIAIHFPSFSDGRGFGIARELRELGYRGRLRAVGHVIADQYPMARRVGFDEVEISSDLALRQDEAQWLSRANWQEFDYQARLGQEVRNYHE